MPNDRLRNIAKMRTVNDGTRTLTESVIMPALIDVLRDWSTAGAGGVLIGDVALSFHARPRAASDLTFLVLQENAIPTSFDGFERTGAHTFRHLTTGIEVRVATPSPARAPLEIAEIVTATSVLSDGIFIASASGLVALLLFCPGLQAMADIVTLVATGRVDLSGYPFPADKLAAFATLTTGE
ncbi:hypothetical protein [Belnapia moabensis]|uniref:hypothetical protein n=1 Tax=Belnapia moabensis TaxID=365533 RepID=UPI0005BB769F|nr:hypothetical protein [Belnapia moabensis]